MDERDIEMLLTLKETRNITQAAGKLFINQSSLSKRLRHLEQRLQAQLFVRTRHGIQFTAAGEAAWETARKTEQLNHQLQTTLMCESRTVRGTLNLGCSINYAQYALPEVLVTFQQQYPAVRLNITIDYSRNIYQQLLSNTHLDVGIVRGEFKGPLQQTMIQNETINLICPSTDDRSHLDKLPFIQRQTDSHFQDEMTTWLASNQHSAFTHQTITVNNLTSCVAFVAHGLGWALVPEIALDHFNGYREPLTLNNQEFCRHTYFMSPSNLLTAPVIEAFKNTLLQSNKKWMS